VTEVVAEAGVGVGVVKEGALVVVTAGVAEAGVGLVVVKVASVAMVGERPLKRSMWIWLQCCRSRGSLLRRGNRSYARQGRRG